MTRRRKAAIGGGTTALVLGAGVFLGVGALDDGERQLAGATRERAVAAALAQAGGGVATETAAGDGGVAYEVEVRRDDGSVVEVHLDRAFAVTGGESDHDGAGQDAGDAGRAQRATLASAAIPAVRLPRGGEAVTLDPADFTTAIDNPYWPMRPGTRWVYRETTPEGARQRVVVTVTPRTKLIANGITARVVTDVVTEGGSPVEVTEDWYAQDRAGSVWYLGEATTEFDRGRPVSTAGSFEAGVDGAQPGIAMPARPAPGLAYRQEYYAGKAEDRARVLSLSHQVEVPFGHFPAGRVLTTEDVNPLTPRILELKFFAKGVGPVMAIGISGGDDREELVGFTRGG